jgi:hypothetical protein
MTTRIFQDWKRDISENKGKIFLSILFLIIALVLTLISGDYVDETRSISVPDLVLDHIPTINLSFIFVYGIAVVLFIFIVYALFYQPKKFHYSIGMLSLFLCIRSAFLILTHLKAPIGAINISSPGIFYILSYSNDLFFSGHAGIPFLGFLIYKNKKIKYFMLSASIILAITSLLMHVHYSIDVASSYFITYGVYKIGNRLFENLN